MKECAYCGKLFQPKSKSNIYCSGPHYMTCPVCGKEYEVKNRDKLKFPPTACSYPCRDEITKRRSLEKYGVTSPGSTKEAREKSRQTMIERYGVSYTLQSKELSAKVAATNLEKYGCENAASNPDVIEKRKQTNKQKYGDVMPFNRPETYEKRRQTVMSRYGCEVLQDESIKQKCRETMLERYGYEYMMQIPEFRASQQATMIEKYGVVCAFKNPEIRAKAEQTMIERYGLRNASMSEELVEKAKKTYFNRYGKAFRSSKVNLRFGEILSNNKIDFIEEKFLCGKFFDFYLPSTNILIEINPTYTHNSFGNHWDENGLEKNYHLKKTEFAEEHGYRCIHVWDWDDCEKVVNLLAPKKVIYARKLTIWKLQQGFVNAFLKDNHLQGTCKGQTLCLGLVDETSGIVYQVMTFGKSRYDSKHDMELLRLCTLRGYKVVGGASKLFKYAVNTYEMKSIISYCDISKFTGDVYEKIGMKFLRQTEPAEIWSMDEKKITANLLRQRGFDQLFNTSYGKGTSNYDLMLMHGWLPIYDCGQYVYEYYL